MILKFESFVHVVAAETLYLYSKGSTRIGFYFILQVQRFIIIVVLVLVLNDITLYIMLWLRGESETRTVRFFIFFLSSFPVLSVSHTLDHININFGEEAKIIFHIPCVQIPIKSIQVPSQTFLKVMVAVVLVSVLIQHPFW